MTGRVSMTLPQYRRHECTIDGHSLRLMRHEAEGLALLLAASPDRGLTRHEIAEAVWPDRRTRPISAVNCVSVHISRLKLLGVLIDGGREWPYRIPVEGRAAAASEPARLAA